MPEWVRLGGETMGTSWSVQANVPDRTDVRALHSDIERALQSVVDQMSHWEPDSDLSRYNRADAGSWHPLAPEFREVMTSALRIARESGGAFNPALGALIGSADIADVSLSSTDWHALELSPHGALLQPGGIVLDLSAIAKGYAADRVLHVLNARTVRDALVEVGGELVASGNSARGAGWNVLLETSEEPAAEALEPRVLCLRDQAVATSGDQFADVEGWVSRTWDPRTNAVTGRELAAVTVVHKDAMQADAWATALMVMGVDAGMAFGMDKGMAVRFEVRDPNGHRERMTDAFRELLVD